MVFGRADTFLNTVKKEIFMLVLTRKVGERCWIGDDVIITILRTGGNNVRIGITAPKKTEVHREEVYLRIKARDEEEKLVREEAVI